MSVLNTHEWDTAASSATQWPTAVLVHGIAGWWRTWWRVGPALAERGWRVVAVDQRGHGDSPPIDGTATGVSLAQDIGETLDSLGIERLDLLLGHSLGAAVSMELVLQRPDLVRCLVLEDPPGSSRVDDFAFQAHLDAEVRAARATPDAEIARALAENPAWQDEDARQNVEGQQRCDLDGILASLRAGTGLRTAELAPRIRVPTLYLLATEERSAIVGSQRERLIRSIPQGSELRVFDAGHTIHRDRFDDYVAAVTEWTDTHR